MPPSITSPLEEDAKNAKPLEYGGKMLKIVGLSLVLGLWTACDSLPKGVGEHDKDQVKLSDASALAHIHSALVNSADLTVADLFDPNHVAFESAPDPTALLQSHQEANAQRSESSGSLSVLSYNVALLDAQIFGFIDWSQSPDLAERQKELPDLIINEDYDILMLQEVWLDADVTRFTEVGEAAGYMVHVGPRNEYNDGCLTLVKKDIVKDEAFVTTGGVAYAERDGLEYFPGPGIKRGFIHLSFEHETLGTFHVYNTHMMPWWYNWGVRMAEARELSLHVLDHSNAEDVVFLGGDMNAGSYYDTDVWTTGANEETDGWWANTISYTLFTHYADFVDLVQMGRTPEKALLDITEGQAVVNNPEQSLDIPGGEADWCETHNAVNFTASDCNALYFEQYGGTEFPSRMDHLFVRDTEKRVYVTKSEIVFTERRTFGDLEEATEPSDHLGVAAWVTVSP
tara:strand:+ start:620 stop:1987 length:1368 start_codon:yes stop_codon:yes gene_type:complete